MNDTPQHTPSGRLQVSLVQMDVEVLQPEQNLRRVIAAVRQEIEKGAQLMVFPELVNTGYIEPLTIGAPFSTPVGEKGYAYELYQAAEPANGAFITELSELARNHRVHIVIGLAMRHPQLDGALYNSSVLIGPQGLLAYTIKSTAGIWRKCILSPEMHCRYLTRLLVRWECRFVTTSAFRK